MSIFSIIPGLPPQYPALARRKQIMSFSLAPIVIFGSRLDLSFPVFSTLKRGARKKGVNSP